MQHGAGNPCPTEQGSRHQRSWHKPFDSLEGEQEEADARRNADFSTDQAAEREREA